MCPLCSAAPVQQTDPIWRLQVAGREVPVDLHRDARVAVPQDALDSRWVGARHHQQAGGGVAEVVEAQWADLRFGPEQVVVSRAAALDRVGRRLGVPAVFLAANVNVALDDSGAAEGTPQHAFERDVGAHHAALLVGEHQLRGRALEGLLEVRDELASNWDRFGAFAFGRALAVRARDVNQTGAEIDVALAKTE